MNYNEHGDKHLVEDFEPTPGTFRIGVKSLNTKSVSSAYGRPNRVLLVTARHLMREIPAEADAGRIFPNLSPKNYILAGPPDAASIAAYAEQLMVQAEVRFPVRKDCIMGLELVFSVPATTSIDTRAYFEASLDWARKEFRPAPVISAVVHLDEQHPHLHVLVLPLIGTSMQGGQVLGFQSMFKRRSRDFFHTVAMEFGLAEPIAKPASSKAEREADANTLVDHIIMRIAAQQDLKLVRKELLKLVSRNPYQLGRTLGVPLGKHDRSNAATGSAADASTIADSSELPPMTDGHDVHGTSTSSLCYDVEAAAAPDGKRSPTEAGPAPLPTYIANGDAKAAASSAGERFAAEPTAPVLPDRVIERDDEQPTSNFNHETGDFERRSAPARSKKAEAEAAVAHAVQAKARQKEKKNHD